MFLDQELKDIREAKNRLAICCELRRHLVQIEIQGIWWSIRRTFTGLTLGLTVAEHIFNFLREHQKGSHH